MLLDLTDLYWVRLGHYLAASCTNDEGARLLNVAVSRARQNVVLIANFEYLSATASDSTIVRHLIDHFATHGSALDVGLLRPTARRP